MPKILQKKFYHCFPNFKCLPTTLTLPFEEEETEQTIKNFNSVFDIPSDSTTSKSLTNSSTLTEDYNIFSSFEDSDSDYTDSDNIPDFSNVFASRRFFFSSPGNSNSIVDFPATTHSPEKREEVVTDGVAVQTYSSDPYSDFRRSMQEMVEAHVLTDVKASWKFLHELLLCYLNLNPKHTHKYIVSAFSDLVVSLMPFDDSGKNIEGTARP
ncbi:hypothetical protein RND71_024565 [Anisodus tanguticus]|uniref:Transcription repressor n=1 Tax=Anisodus tanguticus TaxID=243964 RepID=A0AAE1RQX8_9SOLA|nr:hypothetical protein RND71_024565 [Anisodus tanguticus]